MTETTTLNSFGELAEQKYVNASGTDLDDSSYGYDNDGNVLYEQNNVLSGQSELFTYDGLNRLTNAETGTLNSSHTGMTSTSNSESWSLDALGNWKSSTTNGTTTSRTNNAQNEATKIGSATLGYDANGNTLTDQSGQQYVYDAWNRLVAVKNASGQTIASYGYDALGRRITETENGVTTDLYYSTNWQVVEERQGGSTSSEYVWSPFYVDQLIERDDQPNANWQLTRRLYAQQDADYNVTSLTDSSGNVVERYSYDPYGSVTVENPDGSVKGNGTASASGCGWTVLHQGLMLDSVTGTYDDRNREYNPGTGRFLQQDPAGYIDGPNIYQNDLSSPINFVDPSGTTAVVILGGGALAGEGALTLTGVGALGLLAAGVGYAGSQAIDSQMANWEALQYGDFAQPLPGRNAPYNGPVNPVNGDPIVPPAMPVAPALPGYPAAPPPMPVFPPFPAVPTGTRYKPLGTTPLQQNNPSNSRPNSNPFRGTPGSESSTDTKDGKPKQTRRYGPDGYPDKDTDYDHDHGQGKPHVHDWGRPADGSPPTADDRGPGRPPQPGDPKHPNWP